MKSILSAIRKAVPPFNNDLIVGLRQREVKGVADFIVERYRECLGVIDQNLELMGYRALGPVERLNIELRSNKQVNVINIMNDEASLVEFQFRYHDHVFTKLLYIPYIYENSTIVIGGTKHECLLSMTEKIFSVRTGSNGITIKLIRSPISFWKNTLYAFKDVVTDEEFLHSVTTCKIHSKKSSTSPKKIKPSAIHYLLCKFTLPEILHKFEIPAGAASFSSTPDTYDEKYYYFKVQNLAIAKLPILLKVDKELMHTNRPLRDVVAAIVYLMSGFRSVSYEDLIIDSQTIFKVLLGKLIYSISIDKLHALSYMDKHVENVDIYLDSYTRNILKSNGIIVHDIYDLICFVVRNIDSIVLNCPNNNMYNKRLETINNVIVDSLISALYYKIYKIEKKDNPVYMDEMIEKALGVTPRFLVKNLGMSENVRSSPAVYGDNWLLTIGDKIVKRLSATTKSNVPGAKKSHGGDLNAAVHKFHPSMIAVESAVGFSNSPGINALINPYMKIDEFGGFVRDEFTEEIAELSKYLPK